MLPVGVSHGILQKLMNDVKLKEEMELYEEPVPRQDNEIMIKEEIDIFEEPIQCRDMEIKVKEEIGIIDEPKHYQDFNPKVEKEIEMYRPISFAVEGYFMKHTIAHTKNSLYQCSHCRKVFS